MSNNAKIYKGNFFVLCYDNITWMWISMKETMYKASGVGLAAPQIGKAIRLFLVDTSPFADDEDLEDYLNQLGGDQGDAEETLDDAEYSNL